MLLERNLRQAACSRSENNNKLIPYHNCGQTSNIKRKTSCNMQQGGAIKLKTCNEMGGAQAASRRKLQQNANEGCNSLQLFQDFLRVLL